MLLGIVRADSFSQGNEAIEKPIWPINAAVLAKEIENLPEKEAISQNSPTNVRFPTIRIYFPKRNSSRTAVIVFPGGGYKALAIGKESTKLA